MRETTRRPAGMPFRIWYEAEEIDSLTEAEVVRFCGHHTAPLDIDGLIERHLRVTPEFVPLPAGILGATEFGRDGSVRMLVSGVMSELAERERSGELLLRSTLAHEAAHVLLHRTLFLRESEAIFGTGSARRELCRSIGEDRGRYGVEWWEWQANRGMAGLLMPRTATVGWVTQWRRANPDSRGYTAMLEPLAGAFGVSVRAARLRIAELGLAPIRPRHA